MYYVAAKPKSKPMSFRPSPGLESRIEAIARRTGRTKTSVLESLADEAERSRRYPGIAFRGSDWHRRAWVIGTSLDIWEIIRALQDFQGDADRMAKRTEVSLRHIQLARAYYREFKDEIDQAIGLSRRSVDELSEEYPFIQTLAVKS